ncbi:uncharacterized protein LOC131630043 [Vicia villosa]|uniref:uncharacterized protein LOC131630043 n=1 Tax=Vicia villosa TaxID=3911 RepID=UPI00273B4559|nr:uncharacterized protein LOC131630043 [Vicia villosa]
MLISWNIRGLNKAGKQREICSHLNDLRPDICILIETRVKIQKANKVRENMRLYDSFLDNYHHHDNGRIWVCWNSTKYKIQMERSSSQFIHCNVKSINGKVCFDMTAVYAMNTIEQRKMLWKAIDALPHANKPWCVVGDFNNVLKSNDRIGGRMVVPQEFQDLHDMMDSCGLSEMDNTGDYFTWHNKQVNDPIYTRIDRVIGNSLWFQVMDMHLRHLPPSVSDHELVAESWAQPISGSPPFILWQKLKRLRRPIKNLSRPLNDVKRTIVSIRKELNVLQQDMGNDPMNRDLLQRVKDKTAEILHWNETEEKVLRKKAKVDWIKLGDGNNHYFHATLKAKHQQKRMTICRNDGTEITTNDVIEMEVLKHFGNLMGNEDMTLNPINIRVMREGPQLSTAQRQSLMQPISEKEILEDLHDIGDAKAPGLYGYSAKNFKSCWNIVKNDVVNTINYWFRHKSGSKAFNNTLVTLLPKKANTKDLKDYRPIACCIVVYKIYSKVLTIRMANIIGSIRSHNQAASIPGKQIHSHILLATELIKGYTRKQGTPRCLIQLDLQKAYDMLNWKALETILLELGIPETFVH